MFTAAISGRVGGVGQKDFGDGKLKTQISIAVKVGRADSAKTIWFNCDGGTGKQADFWRSTVSKGDLISATVRVYGFYPSVGTGDVNVNCAIVELVPPARARQDSERDCSPSADWAAAGSDLDAEMPF